MVENRSSLFGIIAIIIGASGLGLGAFSVINFQTIEGSEGPEGQEGLPGQDGQDGIDGLDGIDGINGTDGMDGEDAPGGIVVGILDPDQHDTVWGEIEIRALVYGSNNYSVSVKANHTEIGTLLPTYWNTSLEVEGWYNLTVIIMDYETKITASDTIWILIDNPVSSEKEITSFYFLKWANPGLTSSIAANITGTTITAILPEGSNVSALIASFTTTGVSVEVNNVEQISHITVNDFRDHFVQYVVFAEDGSTKNYKIALGYRKLFISSDTPIDIPNDFPFGGVSIVSVPDLGICMDLSIFVDINNSDIGTLTIYLFKGDIVTLYDGGLSGTTLVTTFPDPSLPVSGDLTTWIGENPAGPWELRVIDFGASGPDPDGQINIWSLRVDFFF